MNAPDEKERLEDLFAYNILDTLPESAFDDIVELASTIYDMPISLITLVDSHRQWFKAKVGLNISETTRQDAFCIYSLHHPTEVLVVGDATKDKRFKNNPLVVGYPNIKFYAGVPLVSPRGNVLGSLCIIDHKRRRLTQPQRKALRLLAFKVIEKLEYHKLTYQVREEKRLRKEFFDKLTSQAPVVIYMMEVKPDGKISFPFVSKNIHVLFPDVTAEMLEQDGGMLIRQVHPDDRAKFSAATEASKQTVSDWEIKYRVVTEDGFRWHWSKAKPEKQADGTLLYYGAIIDITDKVAYIQTVEDMLHDISHVIRKPVSTLIGLANILHEDMTYQEFSNHARHFKTVAEEMDVYTKKLNDIYHQKKLELEKL